MIYRGISVSCPACGTTTYLDRLIQETPWSILRDIFPDIYKEASQLVSLYNMAREVLQCGVVQYYQTLFAEDLPDPNPDRLMHCEEWQCIAFDHLCRFSRCNYAQATHHKLLTNAYKAFRAMEGDPVKGFVKGSAAFERALLMTEHYFFQVCEQKAEYFCKYMGRELDKRISSTQKSKVHFSKRKTTDVPRNTACATMSFSVTCRSGN